jgi:hypothetical protein
MFRGQPRRGFLGRVAQWFGLGDVDDEEAPVAPKPPIPGTGDLPTTTGEAGADAQSSVPVVVGRRIAGISHEAQSNDHGRRRTQEGDWPEKPGRWMLARRGAEAICRQSRRYSRVRIGEIRMDRDQFSVVVHPVPTPGLWNDSHSWTFMGVWDDNYLSICEDSWVSNHISLHIRFNEDQVRGLIAVAAKLPSGEYTDQHGGVAGSYMSLRTSGSRQIAKEISAVVERMHRMGRNGSDTYYEAMSLIPWTPQEVSDDDSEALTRWLDTADLQSLTWDMICLFFPHNVARWSGPEAEADPGPEPG